MIIGKGQASASRAAPYPVTSRTSMRSPVGRSDREVGDGIGFTPPGHLRVGAEWAGRVPADGNGTFSGITKTPFYGKAEELRLFEPAGERKQHQRDQDGRRESGQQRHAFGGREMVQQLDVDH